MLRLLAVLAIGLGALAGCGGDGTAPYVGTWRPVEADSLGVRYTFFADGTARILVRPPLGEPEAYTAQFTVADDSLLTLSDAQGAERVHVHLDGDTLRLESPASGQRTVWVRM